VREVKLDGLLAQVDIEVTEPARVVSIITRESLEEPGSGREWMRRRSSRRRRSMVQR
jgi:hypothetical protein